MTETEFIEKNQQSWKDLELLLVKTNKDPDQLHDLFVKVSSDLAYAQTYYPNRSVRSYLNNLTQKVLDEISVRDQQPKLGSFYKFFTETLPLEVYRSRRQFAIALIVFLAAFTLGVVSTIYNPDFTAQIIGEDYVRMTEENIKKGDPMAVYKEEDMFGMTLGITINNIRVAFNTFVSGIFAGIGTLYLLIYNGIMVGTFQYFFIGKGLFLTSFLTIWIHGTIEISAIIIAAASGLVLATGILFPGSYSRMISLRMAASRAMNIILGTIPLFIIAGLLESFVTRETDMPDVLRMLIIGCSFIFILLMWVILPYRAFRSSGLRAMAFVEPTVHVTQPSVFKKIAPRGFGENLNRAVQISGDAFQWMASKILAPAILAVMILYGVIVSSKELSLYEINMGINTLLDWKNSGIAVFFLLWPVFTIVLSGLSYYSNKDTIGISFSTFLAKYLWRIGLLTLLFLPLLFSLGWYMWLGVLLVFSPAVTFFAIDLVGSGQTLYTSVAGAYRMYIKGFLSQVPMLLIFLFMYFMVSSLISSGIVYFIVNYISWHDLFDRPELYDIYIYDLLWVLGLLLVLPFLYFLFSNTSYSVWCRTDAIDLEERLQHFGKQESSSQ